MEPSTKKSKTKESKDIPLKLFSYWRSSCSWRVRIALSLKGLEYEYKSVHLVQNGGEQFKPDYVSLNPMKQVPTLLHGDKTITQSVAIVEYLEDVFPSVSLFPSDPHDKAIVRSIMMTIAADTQPIQNLRVLLYQKGDKGEWGRYWISNGLEAVEKLLEKWSGKYCFGDNITLADVFLVPQVYNARRFNVDLSRYPNIQRIESALNALNAFKNAIPEVMPDCPENV